MKITAIDDGYFPQYYKKTHGETILLAVKTSPIEVEAAASTHVTVDGRDATWKAVELARLLGETTVILLDGVTYAGFNYIDPHTLYRETGAPVIVYEKYRLSPGRIEEALRRNFPDHEERIREIIPVVKDMKPMVTRWKTIYIYPVGIPLHKAEEIIRRLQIYSPTPEPLRVADMLASIIARHRILGEG